MNRIQLNRTDWITICQRNSFWYSQACDVLGLHPPGHSHWNRGWTAGCLFLRVHCAYLQWSVYTLSMQSWCSTLQSWWPPTAIPSHTWWYCCTALQRMLSAGPAGLGEGLLFGFGHFDQLHEDQPLLSSFHSCSSGVLAQLSFWRVKKLVAYILLHHPIDVKRLQR